MKIESQPIVIDPRDDADLPILVRLLSQHSYINHYHPLDYLNFVDQSTHKVFLTHPVFIFDKPERVSLKTGKIKKSGQYIAVYNPENIGSGHYGAVYPVLGTRKLNEGNLQFKTKTCEDKKRVVKTNALKFKPSTAMAICDAFVKEQAIGQAVTHMGYKYPVFSYNYHSFLLMKRQPGCTLKNLIDGLYDDPDRLSICERLQITIHLVNALYDQVHRYTDSSKNSPNTPLIHNDLKPENIMIDSDYTINIIDYGLAHYQTQTDPIAGTPQYLDPLLLSRNKSAQDTETDWYAMARIIAEFWGDQSGLHIKTLSDLNYRNTNNILVNLLKPISRLSHEEHQELYSTIESMLAFDPKKRPTRENALLIFKKILANRSKIENLKLLHIACTPTLEEITKETLIEVLKSPHAQEFLKAIKKAHNNLDNLIDKIKVDLFNLDEKTLVTLIGADPNFSWLPILTSSIENGCISQEMINAFTSHKLYITEEHLKIWILQIDDQGYELEWAKMCRSIYNACSKGEDFLKTLKVDNSFKSLFYCQYLVKKNQLQDDESNVRQILLHLYNLKCDSSNKMKINELLRSGSFSNTSFAKNILTSELFTQDQKFPSVTEDPHLTRLLRVLTKLNTNAPTKEQLFLLSQLTTLTSTHESLLAQSLFTPRTKETSDSKSLFFHK